MTMRYSLACRPVEKAGVTVQPGHGGRWWPTEAGRCPSCSRPMVCTGAVKVTPLTDREMDR